MLNVLDLLITVPFVLYTEVDYHNVTVSMVCMKKIRSVIFVTKIVVLVLVLVILIVPNVALQPIDN